MPHFSLISVKMDLISLISSPKSSQEILGLKSVGQDLFSEQIGSILGQNGARPTIKPRAWSLGQVHTVVAKAWSLGDMLSYNSVVTQDEVHTTQHITTSCVTLGTQIVVMW